ncbi:MAG: DeoR family transcriptional regulator, partial [Bacillota bacterium]|nr:DeoR family transcriptional regulator [Bacillota bacterium]
MFIEERHQKILNLLKENGSVKVEELSSMFSKSEDSIRRDLRILEKEGLLRKTHGGAIAAGKVS